MARYFFHFTNGETVRDRDGTDFPDLRSAQIEAAKLGGQMLIDGAATFWGGDDWRLRIADKDDLTLFMLDFVGTSAPANPG